MHGYDIHYQNCEIHGPKSGSGPWVRSIWPHSENL